MNTHAQFEYAVATAPLHGETLSGDAGLVRYSGGLVLVAIIDVLGHGDGAAMVAEQALQALRAGPILTVDQHLTDCHVALKGTRGAVMVVAVLDGHTGRMTWSGVGDVEAVLIRAIDTFNKDQRKQDVGHVHMRQGVVGMALPKIYISSVDLAVGDVLIMATDGIKDTFFSNLDTSPDVQHIADDIMSRFSKGRDDSYVLVLRWKGGTVGRE